MGDRFTKIAIGALLVVLVIYVGQPYVDRWLFSASTPRTVEPRGSLADIERTTIEIFERDSPSVVQVVGRAGTLEQPLPESENGPAQSGSGFVWDAAGHIVTNDHVVEGTSSLAVRPGNARARRRNRAQLRLGGDPRRQPAFIAAADRDRYVR
jgi:2-alkenal reductase